MNKCKRRRISSPECEDRTVNYGSSDSGIDFSNSDVQHYFHSVAGKIESLHMVNFMCHSNLEITFNKRVTFVTGKNGSGKSTILAALIIGLGGSANTTGRGSGIADFIKKGETSAKISITLTNDGINSYKRHVYGNQIVIIRSLSKTASNYVCKSDKGEIISKKKEEVDRIRTALDLQIKNPICMLNQDVARTFLSATDNHIRFTMFMRATHLENLKLLYSETVDLLHTSQKELECKRSGIAESNRELSKLKDKLAYYASLEKFFNERTELENEYLWSLVIQEEKNIDHLLSKRIETKSRQEQILETEANYESTLGKLSTSVNEFEYKLGQMRSNLEENKRRNKDLNTEIQQFQRKIDNVNTHLNQLQQRSTRQQSDISSIKEHLKQNEDMASQSKADKEEINEKINKLSCDLSELRDRIETTQRDVDNGRETKLQYTVALDGLKAEVTDLEITKGRLEVNMRSSNVKESTLLKYGPFTPKILEFIDDAAKKNKFHEKPIGPCGLYVTLSGDHKWSRAVESVVGGLMNTYCCDNQKDFQVLNHIMERVCSGKHPPVIISKFQNSRHNVSTQRVSVRGLSSVLDVLSFSNDVVFNTFVDQSRLETILLFETDAQAASLLTHIQNVPRNLRMGLTLQSDQYYPAPNYRTYYGDNNRPLKYFDSPVKSKIVMEKLENEHKKVQLTIKEKNMAITELTNKLLKVTEFSRKSESILKLLKQNERKIESLMSQLKDEEVSKPILPTRLALEEELEVLEKNQGDILQKILSCTQTIGTLSHEKRELVNESEKVIQQEKQFQKEISILEQQLDESKHKQLSLKDKKEKLSTKFQEFQVEFNEINDQIAAGKKLLENKIKVASEVHKERINTERSPVEIQNLLEKCQKYLQAAEKKIESKEIVINEYKIKYGKYKEIKRKIEILSKVVEQLSYIAISKKERFLLLQSHTANLVSLHFQACLQTRGYDGQLKIDFEKQFLELEVIPKDGLARKDTKTLSGGERSYSTVSFILAIWRAVHVPFYFLDEFDVFMDKVNRKVIMDLLLEHAKNQNKMQFIFITPQDISSIQTSDIISIYKMPDPQKQSN